MKIEQSFIKEILLYILIGFIFYLIDIQTKYDKTCTDSFEKKIKFNINILIHSIFINSFLTFGWLSNNRVILWFYLIFVILVRIHWNFLGGQCIISLQASDMCNGNYDWRPSPISLKKIIPLSLKNKFEKINYYLYYVAGLFVIYKLFFKK